MIEVKPTDAHMADLTAEELAVRFGWDDREVVRRRRAEERARLREYLQ